jgi:hypothetical protein
MGRGSLSMQYIYQEGMWCKCLNHWARNHPDLDSLPTPTFEEWVRFFIGYVFLSDRWIIGERAGDCTCDRARHGKAR